MITWTSGQQGYRSLWRRCAVRQEHQHAAQQIAQRLSNPSHRPRYEAVAAKTGVAWWAIAALHYRESDANFSTYLGNGDPLSRQTTHVPRGRGPFATWEAGAIDALALVDPPGFRIFEPAAACWYAEKWNGWGYAQHGVNSPYVWAWTTLQQPGKYIADGVWDAHAQDTQPGCAALWKFMAVEEVKPVPEAELTKPPEDQLEQLIHWMKTSQPAIQMVARFLPAPMNQIAMNAEPLIEDVLRWVEAARSKDTTSADILSLIQMTSRDVTNLITSLSAK